MITHVRRKRQGRIVLLALVIAIAIDKCWISPLWPPASGLIGIDPMPVFLDIPVSLCGPLGFLSVPALFIPCYRILLFAYRARNDDPRSPNDDPKDGVSARLWRASTALLAVPSVMLCGGLIYYLLQPHLPRLARNAIESFGLNIDIYTLSPGYELIHLKGSLIMLACFFIGMHICIRRIRTAPRSRGTMVPAVAAPLQPQQATIPHQTIPRQAIPHHRRPEFLPGDHPESIPESHAAFIPQGQPAQGLTVHDLYYSRNA